MRPLTVLAIARILDAMILVGERDETPVMEATQRIARLVEIMEAVAAAAELSRRAEKAAAEVAKIGKLTVEEGNRGDRAINGWISCDDGRLSHHYRQGAGNLRQRPPISP